MKRVYIAESLVDGRFVMDLLEHAGVPSALFNQDAGGGLGELPVTSPEVWIKRNRDHTRARCVVARFERSPTPSPDAVCEICAEANPSTFEVCWQCSAPLGRA